MGGFPCCCGCVCSDTDIMILVDTTGSMGPIITQVKAAFAIIVSQLGDGPTCKFGVMGFKDLGDTYVYSLVLAITSDVAAVQSALNGLTASGGGDAPEAHLIALDNIAGNWDGSIGGSPDWSRKRAVMLISDVEPHVNGLYPTYSDIEQALLTTCIVLFGFDYGAMASTTTIPNLCTATGGIFYDAASYSASQLADSICDALAALVPCSGSGFISGIQTECCPDVRVPRTLYATISTSPVCALDGLVKTMQYDAESQEWRSDSFVAGGETWRVLFWCENGAWTLQITNFSCGQSGVPTVVCDPFSATITWTTGPTCAICADTSLTLDLTA